GWSHPGRSGGSLDVAETRDDKGVKRELEHHQTSTGEPRSTLEPGAYLAMRTSLVRACASMPSSREMRAATGAITLQASRLMRCQVRGLRNLCTERPAE